MKPFSIQMFAAALLFSLSLGAAAKEPAPGGDDRERTIVALEKAIQADPQNADLWVHLAFAQRKLDRIDRAREAFEKAVALDPKNQDALYMLGLIYEKAERKADALRVWKQYLELSSNPEKRDVAEKHIHHLSQ